MGQWQTEIDKQQIFWLTLDKKNSAVNTLDVETLKEFETILNDIASRHEIKGLVIRSAKAAGFIAGADVTQFLKLADAKEAMELVLQAQRIYNQLENLSIPTIALINGHCLGGGCELILACRYRVCLDDPSVQIGLPEIKLGLIPGWGGTVRLPTLIGAPNAMSIMLAGRSLSARTAKKMGVVDDVVRTPELLLNAARYYIQTQPPKRVATLWERLSNHQWIRPLLSKVFYRQLNKNIRRDQYPAPYYIVDKWLKFGVGEGSLDAEARAISELFFHPTAKHLIETFFLQNKLKALGKGNPFKPQHVHVIGAGTMGGDIAAWCALSGFTVTLQDREPKYIAPAIKRANQLFKEKLKLPWLVMAANDRLQPDVAGQGVRHADVVIEAVFENVEIKHELYRKIEPLLKKEALLATNTSSIMLEELSTVLKDPSRLVGLHFFNPVAKMMLVEVIRGKQSREEEVQKGLAFVGKIKKLPLLVNSSPGFLINRILMPYLMEAMHMYDEGISPAAIDRCAVEFGMPLGPIELGDTVGLDVCLFVGDILGKTYGEKPSQKLRELVAAGKLGRKTGSGFYSYRDGKPVKVAMYQQGEVPEDVTYRLILRMLNEAIACLDEGVVENSEYLDAGMIFATGFAPFRGGLMKYAEETGFEILHERLLKLQAAHGDRFKPHPAWVKYLSNEKDEIAALSGTSEIKKSKRVPKHTPRSGDHA
jgi:3-hydroxyacyl-CoA dehydrogenase/enoyl-CoA hydratase/3-hydroxybutyryl-CoA epimerase